MRGRYAWVGASVLLLALGCSSSGPGFGALRGGRDEGNSTTIGSNGGFGPGGYGGFGAFGQAGYGGGIVTPCKRGGEPCGAFSECCSSTCANGACSACAEDGKACSAGTPCCSGTCFNGTCRSACGTLTCNSSEDCCSGICKNGFCGTCSAAGDFCDDAFPCCGGLECNLDDFTSASYGRCALAVGSACSASAECASSYCQSGKCCGAAAHACTADADCCSGSCVNGACSNCSLLTQACDSVACCGGLECSLDRRCVAPTGTACLDLAECGQGRDCRNGACCTGDHQQCRADPECCNRHCTSGSCCTASECCVGYCTGGVCCADLNSGCQADADCCSGACKKRSFGLGCCPAGTRGSGDACSVDADCCSNFCSLNTCF